MSRFNLSGLPAGFTAHAATKDPALTGARWVQDDSKPGDGAGQGPSTPTFAGASLTDTSVKTGTAQANLGLGQERDPNTGAADIDLGSGYADDRATAAGDTALIGPRTCGPMGDEAAPKDVVVVEEVASVPRRVCGPLDESTGNVALDKILAQFEGMTRLEVRQELSDWDRADLREFRQDFREEFGVGFQHADWLWG
ncbi:MAG TPA: hypothetical protein VD860_12980 [Azospirillum sp.]|nr:hypothetical protein [Azospirillum sp.]